MYSMTARYDLRCPKSKCEEVVIEHRNRPEGPDFYCKKHGFITPRPRLNEAGRTHQPPPDPRDPPMSETSIQCPKCHGPIYLTAPRISRHVWTCDTCGPVYPERDRDTEPLDPCDPSARYDLRDSGNVWDGEGP